ncbi:hypothetical protein BpHYR1_010477 [Brachionus plicatilis]|uniref:Uncharacterized protein n=1 Tax=Brachionus plicatilis TaxID=10195 RepID=A0A3M7S121_BRAPC|nr:hypothetical protein BpHYR1_010477 [Brachionus plicatilis]
MPISPPTPSKRVLEFGSDKLSVKKSKLHFNNRETTASRSLNFNQVEEKEKFVKDLITFLLQQIFHFIRKPDFRIPSSSTLRRNLPIIYQQEFQGLVGFFKDSKVCVICDETTYPLSRPVFQTPAFS